MVDGNSLSFVRLNFERCLNERKLEEEGGGGLKEGAAAERKDGSREGEGGKQTGVRGALSGQEEEGRRGERAERDCCLPAGSQR